MKKYLFIHLLAALSFTAILAQTNTKGITPNKKGNKLASDTLALVIGISDYQNENIIDLQFAHRDAEPNLKLF